MNAYLVKKITHYCNISVKNCSDIPPQTISYFDFTFVIKGSMTYIADGKKYVLKENDAILLRPGTLRERLKENVPVKYASFNFVPFDESLIPKKTFLHNVISSDMKKMLSFYSLSHISPLYRSEEKLLNILNYILLELLNILDLESSNLHVIKMIKYINSHIAEPISLNHVSAHANLSKEYASCIFKAETGKTVNAYINERKMFLAKDMLQTTGFSLLQICESLGYENYSYFSKVFKKHFGISPKQFEKENKK